MEFNYAKLNGKIKERGYNQSKLASEIGVRASTLGLKLKNRYQFTADEMVAICGCLGIDTADIPKYFFAV
jgi:DNA-binding XRE family transcriptional regulator